jgi:hypothetical protein
LYGHGKRWPQDCVGDLEAICHEGGADGREEPARADDALNDGEVAAMRIPSSGMGDGGHHSLVLLMRLGSPGLDKPLAMK